MDLSDGPFAFGWSDSQQQDTADLVCGGQIDAGCVSSKKLLYLIVAIFCFGVFVGEQHHVMIGKTDASDIDGAFGGDLREDFALLCFAEAKLK
jgi:hypothetical protein